MKGFPGYAEEAYVKALKAYVFFDAGDVDIVYKAQFYVGFLFKSGAELRIYNDGRVVYFGPNKEQGIVLNDERGGQS